MENTFTISKTPEILKGDVLNNYISNLRKYKEYIHDINITCTMNPFNIDAHGVILSEKENMEHLRQMLEIQEITNINISLVLNNIYINNDIPTMEKFIKNFYYFYKLGIRSVTLPHVLWMLNGKIKKEFPELLIKSTVLRRVRNGQEFWNYASAGFDVVNVDRLLFRSIENLKQIKEAQGAYYDKTKKYVPISMVVDENCIGTCSFWEEHYQHTMTSEICKNKDTNEEGFRFVMKLSGCNYINNTSLKRSNLIAFQEDIDDILKYVDIIKFGGRRKKFEAFRLISLLTSEKSICHPYLYEILVRNNSNEINILNNWRKKTKNCFYQCWNCNLCDQLDNIIKKSKLKNILMDGILYEA